MNGFETAGGPAGDPQVEAPVLSAEEVAAEAARGRIASLFALGAVLCTSGSMIAAQSMLKDATEVDNWAERLVLFHDNKSAMVIAAILFAVATGLTLPVLLHLATAIRARRPTLPRIVIHLSIAGPLLMALAIPAAALLYTSAANDFAAGTVKTIAEAKRLSQNDGVTAAMIALQAGSIAAGFAWVMIGVYGMRSGLLTRMVGWFTVVVGVITAMITSLSFATNSIPSLVELIRVFVLGAIAVMLVGAPEKRPPAWREGRAIPWPKIGEQAGAQADAADQTLVSGSSESSGSPESPNDETKA
ncbi:MAG: hypothetical protein HZB14_05400 [Actinobacteria bacterium]|nr:hypothetical protein [Actinomycetota bacterium]